MFFFSYYFLSTRIYFFFFALQFHEVARDLGIFKAESPKDAVVWDVMPRSLIRVSWRWWQNVPEMSVNIYQTTSKKTAIFMNSVSFSHSCLILEKYHKPVIDGPIFCFMSVYVAFEVLHELRNVSNTFNIVTY
jgi:hypothetical protein